MCLDGRLYALRVGDLPPSIEALLEGDEESRPFVPPIRLLPDRGFNTKFPSRNVGTCSGLISAVLPSPAAQASLFGTNVIQLRTTRDGTVRLSRHGNRGSRQDHWAELDPVHRSSPRLVPRPQVPLASTGCETWSGTALSASGLHQPLHQPAPKPSASTYKQARARSSSMRLV